MRILLFRSFLWITAENIQKMILESFEEKSNKFHQGAGSHDILVIFAGTA